MRAGWNGAGRAFAPKRHDRRKRSLAWPWRDSSYFFSGFTAGSGFTAVLKSSSEISLTSEDWSVTVLPDFASLNEIEPALDLSMSVV